MQNLSEEYGESEFEVRMAQFGPKWAQLRPSRVGNFTPLYDEFPYLWRPAHVGEFPMGYMYFPHRFSPLCSGVESTKKCKNIRKLHEMVKHLSDLPDIDAELNGKIRGVRIRGRNGLIRAKMGQIEAFWGSTFDPFLC